MKTSGGTSRASPAALAEPPKSKRRLRQRLAHHVYFFANRTSAHGLSRLFTGGRWYRLLWFLLVTGAFIGLVLQFRLLLRNYLSYPVNVRWEVISQEPFVFPDVTVCSETGMSKQRAAKPFLPFSNSSLVTVLNDTSELWGRVFGEKNEEIFKYRNFSRYSLRPYILDTSVFKHPADFIIVCRYRDEQCDFSNFTTFRDPNYNLCMTFKPEKRKREILYPGPDGGLQLILFNGDDQPWLTDAETVGHVRGFLVAIRPPKMRPMLLSSRITAPTDRQTIIELGLFRQIAKDRPNAPCRSKPPGVEYVARGIEDHVTYSFKDSFSECHLLWNQKRIFDRCGCVSDLLMVPKELSDKPTCLAIPRDLLFGGRRPNASELAEMRRKVHCLDHLQQHLRSGGAREKELKDCTVFCSEDEYITSVSVPVWPSNAYKGSPYKDTHKILLGTINDTLRHAERGGQRTDVLHEAYRSAQSAQTLGQTFQIIRVFAKSTRATIKAEELAFPILRFFSNVGGLLGLWIGYSVITLCEVIELFVWLVHSLSNPNEKNSERLPISPKRMTQSLRRFHREID